MPVAGSDGNGKSGENGDSDIDIDIDGDSTSDYGWDLSLEEDVHQLLNSTATPASPSSSRARLFVPVILVDEALKNEALSQSVGALAAAGAAPPHSDPVADDDDPSAAAVLDAALLGYDVNYPGLSQMVAELTGELSDMEDFATKKSKGKAVETVPPPVKPPPTTAAAAARPPAIGAPVSYGLDPASPLARFRSYPRKPLSVSDLTSGAWCELQYEYTLTRLPGGRRTRTPAMRAGTKVHERLEEEVHTTVPITVTTPEDIAGVKLWNMIQGLRTLRETGLTRELEIWGLVDIGVGYPDHMQVVNGVIDALSFQNPDPEGTGEQTKKGDSKSTATSFSTVASASTASQITDYFPSSALDPFSQETKTRNELPAPPPRKIYITDVKTRATPRLPSGAAARPAKIQLFLYHRFLCDLAANRLRFDVIFRRLDLIGHRQFSDAFIAEIGGVKGIMYSTDCVSEYEPEMDAQMDAESTSSWAEAKEINPQRYQTLWQLVAILKFEVARTFPNGADSVGDLVAVEYRMRAPEGHHPSEARCIGSIVMPVDKGVLDRYLTRYLGWWRGARPAKGVEIEEEAGLKCRYCEFAEDCDWRKKIDEERVQRARAKMAAARGVLH